MRVYIIVVWLNALAICALASWQQFPGGDACAMAVMSDESSQKMMAGLATAGLWRSTNGGLYWEPMNNRIFDNPIHAIVDIFFHDDLGDTVILSCYEPPPGFGSITYLSIDGGDSWSLIDEEFANPGSDEEFVLISSQNYNIIYYVNFFYFAVSDNFGETWTSWPVDGTYSIKTGLYQYQDNQLFYSSIYHYAESLDYGGLCRSFDAGHTWEPLIPLYDLWNITWAYIMDYIQLSNGDWFALVGFTQPESWEEQNLLLSTDEGLSWERLGEGLPPRFQPQKIIEDPNLPGRLFIIGNQKYGLYVSDDFGRSWARCLNGLPENVSICWDLEANPYSGDIFVTIDSYGIYKTSDHGETWETIPMPPVGLNAKISVFESSIFCRDYGYRLWRLDQPFTILAEMDLPISQDTLTMFRPIAYQNEDTLVTGVWKRPFIEAVDFFQMAYSYDDGETWEFQSFLSFLPNTYFYIYIDQSVVRFITRNGSGDTVYVSTDLGESWNIIPFNWGYANSFGQNAADIYVSAYEQVYQYDEENNEWISLEYTGPPISRILNLIGDDIYIQTWEPFDYCHCYRYHDGNWELRGEMEWTICFNLVVPVAGDTLFFAASMGSNLVWISEDYGYTWEEVAYELPYPEQTYSFYDLKYDPFRSRIWASTGAGLCYMEVEQLKVDEWHLQFKPIDFSLLEVFPNPFNSRTEIRFEILFNSEVTLSIYNMLGQEVACLVDERKESGAYSVVFDASGLASGMYFCALKTPPFTDMKKIVLMK